MSQWRYCCWIRQLSFKLHQMLILIDFVFVLLIITLLFTSLIWSSAFLGWQFSWLKRLLHSMLSSTSHKFEDWVDGIYLLCPLLQPPKLCYVYIEQHCSGKHHFFSKYMKGSIKNELYIHSSKACSRKQTRTLTFNVPYLPGISLFLGQTFRNQIRQNDSA